MHPVLRAEHAGGLEFALQRNEQTGQACSQQQQRTWLRSWGCGQINACPRKRFAKGIEHGDFTPANVRPGFTFNNLLDLVQDNVFQESVGAYNPLTGLAGSVRFGGDEKPFGFFAEDDWKVKSNLSLTLSLRYDDFTNHVPWGNSGFQFGFPRR